MQEELSKDVSKEKIEGCLLNNTNKNKISRNENALLLVKNLKLAVEH